MGGAVVSAAACRRSFRPHSRSFPDAGATLDAPKSGAAISAATAIGVAGLEAVIARSAPFSGPAVAAAANSRSGGNAAACGALLARGAGRSVAAVDIAGPEAAIARSANKPGSAVFSLAAGNASRLDATAVRATLFPRLAIAAATAIHAAVGNAVGPRRIRHRSRRAVRLRRHKTARFVATRVRPEALRLAGTGATLAAFAIVAPGQSQARQQKTAGDGQRQAKEMHHVHIAPDQKPHGAECESSVAAFCIRDSRMTTPPDAHTAWSRDSARRTTE